MKRGGTARHQSFLAPELARREVGIREQVVPDIIAGVSLCAAGAGGVPAARALPGAADGAADGPSRRERLTLMRMWELLREDGYAGSYDPVRRYARGWRRSQGHGDTAYEARHLRQHEDGGRHGVCRQGPAVQPPLCAAVQSLSGGTGGLYAGCGLGEGQVENQLGTIRERWFTPRLRFASYAELNAWLLDQCVAWARRQSHPDDSERTVVAVFEAENGPR